jgi:4-deoxy-L-threo-5-hexosulose-uronate ketol-isomerase
MDGPVTDLNHDTMRHQMRYLPGPVEARRMGTEDLRANFLLQDLFVPDQIVLHHVDLDRVVVGGAVPASKSLRLTSPDSLAADKFTLRRELAVLNIGGPGEVSVEHEKFSVGNKDVLYIGRGAGDVVFECSGSNEPPRFYIVSYPAHIAHPTTLVDHNDVQGAEIGDSEHANRRRVARYIHLDGAHSAQLVMGVTELSSGSVWNTMPAHTHHRRTEIYLYFGLPPGDAVVHLMGEPDHTRHLIVRDGEVVLSPGWSVHAGCGTSSYSFCWAMGGENQDYADMQPAPINSLR